jgi:hypothetical protein
MIWNNARIELREDSLREDSDSPHVHYQQDVVQGGL